MLYTAMLDERVSQNMPCSIPLHLHQVHTRRTTSASTGLSRFSIPLGDPLGYHQLQYQM